MGMLFMPEWLRSGLLLVMIILILTGRRSGAHEQRKRLHVEQAGLRAALLAEFAALRAVYRLNLDLIDASAPQLISGRPYFSVYRGNMTRLVGLTPAEVSAVVAAHAACDTLDAAVQIGMRMRARHSNEALWDARGFELWRLQRSARHTADEAATVLQAAVQAAEQAASLTYWQQLMGWLRARQLAPMAQGVVATEATLKASP
jgi:hypothetical protein